MEHIVTKDRFSYRFDKNIPPVLRVQNGDIIRIETRDCFSDTIRSESDRISSDIDINQANPVTGPIYVEGLSSSDTLGIEILDIRLNPVWVTGLMEGVGILADEYEHARTGIGKIENDLALFRGFHIPIRPMVGTIGTVPLDDAIPSLSMGAHGGNMDHPTATVGSTIYLPVNVPGGLFSLGDLHAAMGDGEITALSAEASGWVTVKVEIMKDKPIERPFFKTSSAWVTTGNAENFKAAITMAANDMQALLCEVYALDRDTAAMLMGIAGDMQISQCAHVPGMNLSVRFSMPFLEKEVRQH